MSKVIFLDFDGVMNSTNKIMSRLWFYPQYIQKIFDFINSHLDTDFYYDVFDCKTSELWKLYAICKATDAEIVLDGSIRVWFPLRDEGIPDDKFTRGAKKFLDFCFIHNLNFNYDSRDCRTYSPPDDPEYNDLKWREGNIQYYLDTHPEVENYVIIDDERSCGHFLDEGHFVYTRKDDYTCGMKWKHVFQTINILNKEVEEYGSCTDDGSYDNSEDGGE